MTVVDVYGPCVDDAAVESAWLGLALRWVDTYLVVAERSAGENPRTYGRPLHWRLDDEARILIEDVTPLLVCVSPGEPQPPEVDGEGVVASTLRIRLCAYYRANEIEIAHVAARRYAWALATLVDHKAGELAGVCQLASRPRKAYGDVIVSGNLDPLGQCIVEFDTLVDGARLRYGGPADPIDPDPGVAPPVPAAGPIVQTVEVDIEPLDDPQDP